MSQLLFQVKQQLEKHPSIKKINSMLNKDAIEDNMIFLEGIGGSLKGLLSSVFFNKIQENEQSILFITATSREAEEMYQDAKNFVNPESVYYFPDWEIMPYEHISPFQDIMHHRILVLHQLLGSKNNLLFLPFKALIRHLIPPEIFASEYINLAEMDEYPYNDFIQKLVELGYSRVEKVIEPGTFSVRGGIIDIFPSSLEDPVRIEFFGDNIESLRTFEVMNQRSIDSLSRVEILPQKELILTDRFINNAFDLVSDRFSQAVDYEQFIENLSEKIYFQGIEQYLPFFYEPATLLDYLPANSILIFDNLDHIQQQVKTFIKDCQYFYDMSHKVNIIKATPAELFAPFEELTGSANLKINLTSLKQHEESETTLHFHMNRIENYLTDYDILEQKIAEALSKNMTVVAVTDYEQQFNRMIGALQSFNPIIEMKEQSKAAKQPKLDESLQLTSGKLYLTYGSLSSGFIFGDIMVVLDRELFGRKKKTYKKLRSVHSSPVESFLDLKPGNLVVHINHGIGRFKGIQRIKTSGRERDYILILYADNEKLYVPIEQLNLVQRYIGSDDKRTALDKLGGKLWEKRKNKAQKSIEEFANELVKIYHTRLKTSGYKFSKDTEYQIKFENQFEYMETPDQLTAIQEVKDDMESPQPMDRLICGDVGYGKTEVAIRAAFKAVMEGKQVAVLVPTTILCEQHYLLFKERFKDFPINIEMLSRFRHPKQQKQIIEKIKNGGMDIIIGTHRIVSKDIQFKNLGLVIIDEEQRFGVRHKERFKQLRLLVDVLTMSATPIPRTLYLSLAKIRDMSVINTPPENRLPIETYTMEFNEEMIKKAIQTEIDRGGQVYFVFNRVKGIKSFAAFLHRIVPGIRIAVAHGQMEEEELERIMRDFIQHRYDVLVSTTIIENGLDIPNVNTILIDRADTLGLSQLYQLRGRVGRSKRQAYCYLFFPSDKALTETAQKRLAVINEFTDLGSGFKIAMRDLEIRGAGNIFGTEQSGEIAAIGFDLYCKFLDMAVHEITTGEKMVEIPSNVDLSYSGYIPDDYIPDITQKMEIYKKIAGATQQQDIKQIREELADRFGDLPPIVEDLIKLSELKALTNHLLIPSIVEKDNMIKISFIKESRIDPIKILSLIDRYPKRVLFTPEEKSTLFLKIKEEDSLSKKVGFVREVLNGLQLDQKQEIMR